MRWVGLKDSLVSSLVTEYRDLLFLAAFTFCALCTIHFFSTIVFYRGEWSELFSGGVIMFSPKEQ